MSCDHIISEADFRKFHNLQEQISACRYCQDDFGFEPHPILFGNLNAKIMEISQTPSPSVHNTGKPFISSKGTLLFKTFLLS